MYYVMEIMGPYGYVSKLPHTPCGVIALVLNAHRSETGISTFPSL
jgi:hypothetical protein